MPMVWVGLASAALGATASGVSAKQSQDYAERSYRTRYQTQVKDLKKAGLNPMLAVSQGPGSPPQPNIPDYGDNIQRGAQAVTSAYQAKLAKEQTEVASAVRNKTIAEGKAQDMENLITEASEPYQSAKATLGEKGEVRGASAASSARWNAELDQVKAAAAKTFEEAENLKVARALQEGELTLQEIRIKYAPQLAEIEASYREAMKTAAEAGVPAALADKKFWETAGPWGKLAIFVKTLIGK